MALTTVPASLSATAITLTTAAQPNITSVGTLTGLTVSGNIAGTLTTAAQTNITSVGTLGSLTVTGTSTLGVVDASSFTDVVTNTIYTQSGNLDIDTVLTGRDVTFTQGSTALMTIKGNASGTTVAGDLTVDTDTLKVDSSNNRVGIGTASPDEALHVKGDGARMLIGSADYELFSIGRRASSGAGLDQAYIRMKSAGTNTVIIDTDGPSYFNGGNVGIGIALPSAPLDVVTNSTVWAGEFTQSNTSNGDGVIVTVGSTASADYALSIRSDAGNRAGLNVKADGNVGIGTFTPTTHLSVTNSGFSNTSTTGIPAIRTEGNYGGAIGLLDTKEAGWYAQDSGDTLYQYVGRTVGSNAPNANIVMTYKSSGNIGIGEDSPLRRLSVRRDTGITAGFNDISQFLDTTLGAGGSVSLNLGRANSTKNLGKMAFKYAGSGSNSNALNFGFYDADNLMTLLASGRVGIGHTSPNARLHINAGNNSSVTIGDATNPALQIGGTTNYRFGVYTDGETAYIENKNGDDGLAFRVKTAGEAMRIDGGTGRVGIGDPTPRVKLEVHGGANEGIILKPNGQITYTPTSSNFYNGITLENAGSAHAFSIAYGQGGWLKFSYFDNASTYKELAHMRPDGDLHLTGDIVMAQGKGISFINAADTALGETVSSSVLDDYEEGSWTPGIGGYSGGTCTMGSANMGRYVRIGQQVTVNATVHIASVPTLSGSIVLTGLPFLTLNQSNYRSNASPVTNTAITPGSGMTMLGIGVDANYRFAWIVGMNPTTKTYTHTPTVGTGFLYGFAMTYMTNS